MVSWGCCTYKIFETKYKNFYCAQIFLPHTKNFKPQTLAMFLKTQNFCHVKNFKLQILAMFLTKLKHMYTCGRYLQREFLQVQPGRWLLIQPHHSP